MVGQRVVSCLLFLRLMLPDLLLVVRRCCASDLGIRAQCLYVCVCVTQINEGRNERSINPGPPFPSRFSIFSQPDYSGNL